MLPGLRFFFAAVILSMSLLVFGLGAAALLRSAHEEVANLPVRRAPAPAIFTQRADSPPPSLAMLRVDAGAADADDTALPFAAPATPPAVTVLKIDQAADTSAPRTEPAIIALEPEVAAEPATVVAATEMARPAETSTASEPETPARPELPAIAIPTQIALAAEPPAFEHQQIKAEQQPAATLADDSVRRTSSRIATLGSPAVRIETETTAKAAAIAARKAKARRIAKRRRFLARLRLLRQQQAQAQPLDPFAPTATTAPASRIASTSRTPSAGR